MLRPLFEAVIPSLKSAIEAADRRDLQDTIYRRLNDGYTTASRKALDELYEGSGRERPGFHLQAKWKQKALQDQAKAMSSSLSQTVANEEARLRAKGLPEAEVKAKLAEFYRYKTVQLNEIIKAEVGMQAQVDQLVHSGAVNPSKDRVMYLVGPHTCPWCQMIFEGNPWTVNEATNYGAKIHPNCRDHWDQHWSTEKAVTDTMRQRVRDGTLTGWGGQGRTPGEMSAKAGQEVTRRFSNDWRELKKKAIADARRKGTPSQVIDENLTEQQRKQRARTERRTQQRRQKRLER